MKGLFSGRAKMLQLEYITSILIGAGLIVQVEHSELFMARDIESIGCLTKDGFKKKENAIRVEILSLLNEVPTLEMNDVA
jgi:hypothetical protein